MRLPSAISFLVRCAMALCAIEIAIAEPDSRLLRREKLSAPSGWAGGTLFESIRGSAIGVDMDYPLDPDHPMRRLYPYGWATGNCAIGDLDGDGRLDLFFPGTTGPHKLFLQRDGFRFEEADETSGIPSDPGIWGSAAIMGDIDRDFDLDIYVVNYGAPNQLFVNISRGGQVRFTEMAEEYGVAIESGSLGASFVDFNGDGWLDLFVQTYHIEPEGGRPEEIEMIPGEGGPVLPEKWERSYLAYLDAEGNPRWVEAGLSDALLINNRRGAFVDSEYTGLAVGRSYGVSHLWWDLDNDLRPDLYTGNGSHEPDLFYRQSASGRLVEVGRDSVPCSPWFPRGATAADFNNDLEIDFFGACHAPLTHRERLRYGEPFPRDIMRTQRVGGPRQVARNVLLANTGAPRFEEVARLAGVAHTGAAWAVKSGDYDCDGRIDLFVANGEARDWSALPSADLVGENLVGKTRWDLLEGVPEYPQRDFDYRNLGDWNFEESGKSWGLDHRGMTYCASQGDLDGDGDLDLVVCRLGEEVTILRNHTGGRRLVVTFEGDDQANTSGVGVEMLALVGTTGHLRHLYPTGGFKSSDESAIHLGLGDEEKVDRVTLRWPGSGAVATFVDWEPGFRYIVREGENRRTSVQKVQQRPLFSPTNAIRGARHRENSFDTARTQPMVPEGLAFAGPGLALNDLDGDGLSEILFTGATGQGDRFIARSPGLLRFRQPFSRGKAYEGTAAVYFDADGDGDLDLYLGSGGIEFAEDPGRLRDRLFLNVGLGRFAEAPPTFLPAAEEITGAVAAADFDRDGDVDLFVGARMKRHHYPLPGRNQLLVNRGDAKFDEGIDAVAPGLVETGMVTGAIWTDVDDDGWLDLLLSHDWGTPQLWMNRRGKLENATGRAGLEGLSGRWNGVTGRDIDADGDIDYLLSNIGHNTGDNATRVFARPVPDAAHAAVVFVEEDGAGPLPSYGWSHWGSLPSIRERVNSPAAFVREADALLGISATEAQGLVRERRTGLLINEGGGRLRFRPMPVEAQFGPASGVVLSDFDFDGQSDAFVLQNDMSATLRHPDPGNKAVSRLFLGTGDSETPFRALSPAVSGLVLYGAGRAAAVTDLDGDSRADLICTINDASPVAYLNTEPRGRTQPLKVQLDFSGKLIPGARVSLEIPGFPRQTAEYYAGGGYLSQSSSDLFFGAPADLDEPVPVEIRWSDGTVTRRLYYLEDR